MKIHFVILVIVYVGMINSASFKPKKFNCDNNPIYRDLEISTTLNENSEYFNIKIFTNCKIEKRWQIKDDNQPYCEAPNRVFEGEDIIRRPIRFSLKQNRNKNDRIYIEKINLKYPSNIADTQLTKSSFELAPGEYVDFYVEYECRNMNKDALVPAYWYKLQFEVVFRDDVSLFFEYWKICEAYYADLFDVSHFIIIFVIFIVIDISFIDKFNSQIESQVVTKFHEMKNPQNLLIIGIVIGLIMILSYVIDILNIWLTICLIIVVPMSIGMIIEAFHKDTSLKVALDKGQYIIPYANVVITNDFIFSFGLGLLMFLIWEWTHWWILCDIIAIAISIISIRIFKFTSAKFIISLYVFIIIAQAIWIANRSDKFNENMKLANNNSYNFPIRLLCPELVGTPFQNCNSLPISDIILPGLFLNYSNRFDNFRQTEEHLTYFYVGLISVVIGIIMNLSVYYFLFTPTPLFFYTGISLIICSLLYAYLMGDIDEFLSGFKSTEYGDIMEMNIAKLSQQDPQASNSDREGEESSNIRNQNNNNTTFGEGYTPQSYEMKEMTTLNDKIK